MWFRLLPAVVVLAAMATLGAARAVACPFCTAESQTLTEEIDASTVVGLAKLSRPSEAAAKLAESDVPYGFVDPDTGGALFTFERLFKGEDLPAMAGVTDVEVIFFGEPDMERLYLLRGIGDPPDWAIPLPLSEVASAYVPKLFELPPSGADRLAYFQEFLEHEDPLLAQDAYDEFARAPYQDVIDLAPRMDRAQLLAWVQDAGVSPSRRRLFLTMLGVCGQPDDLPMLRSLLLSDARALGPGAEAVAAVALAAGGGWDLAMLPESVRLAERQRKLGLDALIACYLTLAGQHGDVSAALDLIDERFLEDRDADYSHVYASLQALRFLVEEQSELVPIDRSLRSARLLLDHPDFADQVIPDLARWEDWSVLDRLVSMYRMTFDEDAIDPPAKYVREPIITYLDVAAELESDVGDAATAALAELEPLDPKVVERARSLRAFGFLAQARPAPELDEDFVAGGGRDVVSGAAESGVSVEAEGGLALPPDPRSFGDGESALSVVESGENSPPVPPVASAPPASPAPDVAAPPSRTVLVGLPLAAAAVLVGLFWLILRSGGY